MHNPLICPFMIQLSTVHNCSRLFRFIAFIVLPDDLNHWIVYLPRYSLLINAWDYVFGYELVFGLCFICWDAGGAAPFHCRSIDERLLHFCDLGYEFQ